MNLRSRKKFGEQGIMLVECIAYIAGLAVVMGLAYGAYYRSVFTANGMRRNANDVVAVTKFGERWRDDVRAATGNLVVNQENQKQTVKIPQRGESVVYLFETNSVKRIINGTNTNSVLLNVKNSQMQKDQRKQVAAWRWEVELNSRRDAKVRPLFSFLAIPEKK